MCWGQRGWLEMLSRRWLTVTFADICSLEGHPSIHPSIATNGCILKNHPRIDWPLLIFRWGQSWICWAAQDQCGQRHLQFAGKVSWSNCKSVVSQNAAISFLSIEFICEVEKVSCCNNNDHHHSAPKIRAGTGFLAYCWSFSHADSLKKLWYFSTPNKIPQVSTVFFLSSRVFVFTAYMSGAPWIWWYQLSKFVLGICVFFFEGWTSENQTWRYLSPSRRDVGGRKTWFVC